MIIGVVGKTGSGKSCFADFLKKKGFFHLELDLLGKELPVIYPEILIELSNNFGNIVISEGKIDRKVLGEIVFRDEEKLDILNSIFFPYFKKEVCKNIAEIEGRKNILVDGVIIFEAKLNDLLDKVFYITASDKIILKRLQEREPKTPVNVLEDRIKIQNKYATLMKKCNYIIENNSTLLEFHQKIDYYLNELEKPGGMSLNKFYKQNGVKMPEYKTDYLSHDIVYKNHRMKGLAGWGETQESYLETWEIITDFLKKTKLPLKSKGLDLGCGAGNNAIWLANNKFTMSGIDLAPTAIDWARERSSEENLKIDFRLGSAVTLEVFQDQTFDFIIDSACLHCIIGNDRKTLYKNVLRTLKKGGFFLVMTMSYPYPKEMENDFDKETNCMMRNGKHARYFGKKEDLLKEITESGLNLVEYNYSDKEGNGYLTAITRKM